MEMGKTATVAVTAAEKGKSGLHLKKGQVPMKLDALAERMALYEELFDNMLDGLAYCRMIFDADERPVDFLYLQVNKNFEALTGLKNAEGRKVSEVIPGIRASNPEVFEIYGRVSRTGKAERFETYVAPLSRWFWISVYSPRRDYFIAVFQNITEQKQVEKDLVDSKIAVQNVLEDLTAEKLKAEMATAKSEGLAKDLEKFKLAVDNVSDNIIITDPEGTVIYANKAVEKITGYKPEEAIGKKSGALWKAPMPQEYYRKLWDTIKNQKKFSSERYRIKGNPASFTRPLSVSPRLSTKRAR